MTKGKLIVLEGIDGSGKHTQSVLLEEFLTKKGIKVKQIRFPQHGKKSAIPAELYLNGRFGPIESIDPFLASCLYSLDRLASANQIRDWLNKGYYVIADRYTTANLGHHGAKFDNKEEREEFFKKVLDLEYNKFDIPKPDIIIFINIPHKIALELLKTKTTDRSYIEEKDLHETEDHLKKAELAFQHAVKLYKWKTINSCKDTKLLSKQDIHKKIIELV